MPMLISSCGREREEASEVPTDNLEILRFERDLFETQVDEEGKWRESLHSKYGSFFNLYAFQVMRLGSRDSSLMQENFRSFLSDTNFRNLYDETSRMYADFSPYASDLSKAFSRYKNEFPDMELPRIITLITGFSYPVIADSALLAIGLDMYLGTDNRFYSTIDPPLPMYMRKRMRSEYIVPDALRGWLQSDFAVDESSSKMIELMIDQGRIIFALQKLLPDKPDTLLFGYSTVQLEWCKNNEAKIWSFFIENKLLFSNDPNQLMKYAGDGPGTKGFPPEAPGNIGKYIGFRIVQAYMKKSDDAGLYELMKNQDLQEIFSNSGYKPAK
ncbi:MAG: hypothetical protein DWQ44_05505 [Bacteroidetes bacterium]|nr:MAG: hypothetical protein DWQ33_01090 [Bacteroidota bacterium]REK34784.1 MAG: hypothetical protein DWQ44_05505 [Bacteroidota bacterium]